MTGTDSARIVTASRTIAAPAAQIFALVAAPAEQIRIDGNDNLSATDVQQRVSAVGDVFTMELTNGETRENLSLIHI